MISLKAFGLFVAPMQLTAEKDLFCYLKGVKKDQKYWLALGNKQFVYNKGGAFVAKAEKA